MTAQEVPVSTRSANSRRGWRSLALFAVLALSASCSGGGDSDRSADAQRDIFIGNSGAQGPRELPVLVDCARYPEAMGGVAAIENPDRVGDTYILGTYDETAPLTPGGQKTVVDGLRVVHTGARRYTVSSANKLGANPLEVLDFNGDNSKHVAEFALSGASVTIESVAKPDDNTIAAFVASIVCTQTTRS